MSHRVGGFATAEFIVPNRDTMRHSALQFQALLHNDIALNLNAFIPFQCFYTIPMLLYHSRPRYGPSAPWDVHIGIRRHELFLL